MRVKIQKKLLLLTIASIFVLSLVAPMTLAKVDTVLNVPDVTDMGMMPFTTFSVDITASNVERLFGFEYVLTFDPSILMALSYSSYYPFTDEWPSEIGFDYVAMASACMPINTDGITTDDPVPIAKIDFLVLDYGATALDLTETILSRVTDLGAEPIHHVASDGLFANVEYSRINLQSANAEHRTWIASKDPDNTLYGKVKNHGSKSMLALVEFTIRTEDGMWAKTFESAAESIAPHQTRRLEKTLLTGNLRGAGKYFVSTTCYFDIDGDSIVDISSMHTRAFIFTLG